MKQVKHTPGPWTVEYSSGVDLAHVKTENHGIAWTSDDNARLIAAAPELLNALELCLEHGLLGTLMVEGKLIDLTALVEDALNKAKGTK